MTFAALPYYFLVLVVIALYWSVKNHRFRLVLLLAASYVFYFEWSYKYSLILIFVTLLNYFSVSAFGAAGNPLRRKVILILGLVLNLGVLGLFKYYNFFVTSFVDLTSLAGLKISPALASFLLPVGISFYTFQAMSYLIDCYQGKITPCGNLLQFAVYVAFFPQLVAGPVERADHLLPQFNDLAAKKVNWAQVRSGISRILWGLFKKVVVANSVARQVDFFFAGVDHLGAWTAILGAVGFAVQIYCDFSAYTDIAVGTSRLFGIDIRENFFAPYLATSPRVYWRRWHMTMSNWFRDYVFIPLGGSRVSTGRAVGNILITMFLVGLWHGAAYTFILWGVSRGVGIAANMVVLRQNLFPRLRANQPLAAGLGWLVTITFELAGWLIFRAESLGQLGKVLRNLFLGMPATIPLAHLNLLFIWVVITMADQAGVLAYAKGGRFKEMLDSPSFFYISSGFVLPLLMAFFFRGAYWSNAFIYFAF
ncbi:MAG: MBOAT family protein [Deltaproteobacteria bacterium]|nr:MBOAT family protein [Deltaproteobacteria bacterium]